MRPCLRLTEQATTWTNMGIHPNQSINKKGWKLVASSPSSTFKANQLRSQRRLQSQKHLILRHSVPVNKLFPLTAGRDVLLGDPLGQALRRPGPRGAKSSAEIR